MKTLLIFILLLLLPGALLFGTEQPRIHTLSSSSQKEAYSSIRTELGELPKQKRKLLTITRNPIRITLDSSTFNTIIPGPSGSGTTTSANLAFILRAMQVAQNFYQTRLKVYPLSSLQAPASCTSDYNPSLNDQTFGIGASDLHIYVLYKTDKSLSYGATGASCRYFGTGGTLPDSTLQIGRPVVGRIIFNTYNLVDTLTSLTNLVFQSVTATALHETLHILGFDSTRFPYWLDSDENSPRFGNVYLSPVQSGTGIINSSRPSTNLLTTPAVTKWAQDFFNCTSLVGMLLENQDGTGLGSGSHWERLAMYDELMTATALGSLKYFSGLTFAALKDMGWYTVDDTFSDTSNYGYRKGCQFLYDACNSTISFSQFCNAATTSSISTCQTNFFGKAICSNTASAMADSCGIYGPYSPCVDPTLTDSYTSYTQEAFGTSSFCVASTLGTVALPNTLTSRCYPHTCTSNSIIFTVGTYTITCLSSETGAQKTLSAMTGSLTCPLYADFCTRARKTCENWCSRNGYCMGGVCNCLTGFYGKDCSKTICTSGQYFNPLNNTCVTVCPSNYYQNIYSRSCEQCDTSVCQECYGTPTTCIGCISTANNPQYFYNNTCYSICPDGTFADGFNCSVCDSSVFCATCSMAGDNCTSCAFDSANNQAKYLDQPGYGTCINACPVSGTYTITDIVNNVCVQTCDNNLILNGSTCIYCQNNTYKLISNSSCVSSCPNFFYADTTNYLCAKCDSSCLTCSGGYAQNCTSCSSTATLRYWLLQMCWSICPGGYYANDTSNACQICPTTLNCGNCTYQNSTDTVVCTSCAYGYYFQASDSTCTAACNSSQFANKANNTCLECSSACATCSGPVNSTCTSCPSGKKLLTNVTGSFCVASCNPVGYTSSSLTCLACDSSCYTCGGTANNECSSCPNGTFLNSGYCRLVCPAGTFPNTTSNQCSFCDGSCTFCFGPTIDNCTGCISTMVLYNFTCALTCPSGYTVNQWNVCYDNYLKVILTFLLLLIWIL